MPDGSLSLAEVEDFSLGPYRVRPSLNQVLVTGRWERLEPRIMKVLVLLARPPGRVVSRDELMRACWGRVFVGEDALNRCVSRLRGFFRDHGEAVSIETIPKVGYRLTLADWAEATASPLPSLPAATEPAQAPPEMPAPEPFPPAPPRPRFRALPAAALASLAAAGAALAAALLLRAPETAGPAGAETRWEVVRVIPAVREPDMQLAPSLSPDGELLAYNTPTPPDRNADLHLRRLDGSAPTVLTDHPDWDISPTFSPDGRRIAYVRTAPNRPCEIRVRDIAGGDGAGGGDRAVRGCGLGGRTALAWTQDGRHLFHTMRDEAAPAEPAAIYRTRIADGVSERLTRPPRGASDIFPALSPDGRTLAFTRASGSGVSDIHLLDLGDGTERQVTRDGMPQRNSAWDRSGRGLFFVSARAGDQGLWWVPAEGGEPRRISAGTQPLGRLGAAAGADRLAVEVENHQASLARLPVDGSGEPAVLVPTTAIDRDPDVAPDGTIVFASERTIPSELWLLPPGGAPAKLTSLGDGRVEMPRWSPDGSRIAFSLTRRGNADIYVIDRDGGSLRRLTDAPAADRFPDWTADGKGVVFTSDRSGARRLWRIDAAGAGGPAEPVTGDGVLIGRVDGDRLYYVRDDRPGLWRRPLAGGAEEPAAPTFAPDDMRVWDVRDGLLTYIDRQAPGGAPALVAAQPDAGTRVPLVRIRELYEFSTLAIAPGGREIVFSRSITEDVDIQVLELARR